MGFKLPDHSVAGPVERRWFAGLMASSLMAALVFYGHVALHSWGMGEIKKRYAAAGTVGSVTEFAEHLRFAEWMAMAVLVLCVMGFTVCAGMWFRTMRIRLRSGEKK